MITLIIGLILIAFGIFAVLPAARRKLAAAGGYFHMVVDHLPGDRGLGDGFLSGGLRSGALDSLRLLLSIGAHAIRDGSAGCMAGRRKSEP